MANSPFKAAYNQLQTASEKVKQESARSPATTGRATKTTKANTQLETPTKRRYAGHDIDDDEDLVAVDDEEEEVEGAEFEDDEVEQQELDDEEGEGEEDDEEEVQDEDVEEEEVEEEEVAQITSVSLTHPLPAITHQIQANVLMTGPGQEGYKDCARQSPSQLQECTL